MIFHSRCEQSSYRQFDFDIPGVVDILDGVLVPCGRLEQIIFVERYDKVKMGHRWSLFSSSKSEQHVSNCDAQ